MSMFIARLVLWCLLGLIMDSAGYNWTTALFWCVMAIVWAIEQIVWIEFREALEDYILTQRRLNQLLDNKDKTNDTHS